MSYHVELPATDTTEWECWGMRANTTCYSVGTFAGPGPPGKFARHVQITVNREVLVLDLVQLERLRMVLEMAAESSLLHWPGAS